MKKQLKKIALSGGIIVLMAGCSTVSRFTLDTDFDSSPVKTHTKMSKALQCLSDQLEKNIKNPSAYVFMVRDVIDGTIKHNNYSDGPLSDSGRIQMISTLSAHTNPSYGLVTDQFPLMFKPIINEQVGLDRYGFPSQANLGHFLPRLTEIVNVNRFQKGRPAVNSVTPLIIDGAFTRNDSSHQRSKGYGQNGGYRGDVEDEESGAFDLGNSGSERSVTLVINIIDPKSNIVIGTEGFDLKYYSNSKTARFRVAIDDFYYGFSNTNVRVETLHAAQQTLLDGAAVWILDNAFGNKVDFSPCFDKEETLALGKDSRYEKVKAQKAELAKQEEIEQQLKKSSARSEIIKVDVTPLTKVDKDIKSEPLSLNDSSDLDDSIFADALKGGALKNVFSKVNVGCAYLPSGRCEHQ